MTLAWPGAEDFRSQPLERLADGLGGVAFGAQYSITSSMKAGVELYLALARLLSTWPMSRVEEEAWLYAIVWSGEPPLVSDYDLAVAHYFALGRRALQPQVTHDDANLGALNPALMQQRPLIESLLNELSTRVQFLQTRAADLRLSRQVGDLVGAFAAREAAHVSSFLESVVGDESLARIDVGQLPSEHRALARLAQASERNTEALQTLRDAITSALKTVPPSHLQTINERFLTHAGGVTLNVLASQIYTMMQMGGLG